MRKAVTHKQTKQALLDFVSAHHGLGEPTLSKGQAPPVGPAGNKSQGRARLQRISQPRPHHHRSPVVLEVLILDTDLASPGPWVEILDACAGLSALLQRRPGSPLAMAEQLEGHLLICFALSCPLQIRIYSPVRQI